MAIKTALNSPLGGKGTGRHPRHIFKDIEGNFAEVEERLSGVENAPSAAAGTRDSVTAAKAERIPVVVQSINTAGYDSSGDGGGGFYKRVGAKPAHSGYFTDALGAYWELQAINGEVNIRQFGAKADDATDCRAAMRNAVDYQSIKYGGGTVRIPAGRYRKAGTGRVTLANNIRIVGDGMYLSIIHNANTGLGASGSDINNGTVFGGDNLTNIELCHFGIDGDGEIDNTRGPSHLRFSFGKQFKVHHLWLTRSRGYGMFFNGGNDIEVMHCRLHLNMADNIAAYNTPNLRVSNNLITCSQEDGVAYHNVVTAPSAHSGIVITDNIIIECPGIHGNASHATITGNVLIRPRAHGIWATCGSNNIGDRPSVSVVIANNTVSDCFVKPEGAPGNNVRGYIYVGGAPRHSNTNTLINAPGNPDGAGNIVPIYGSDASLNYYRTGTNKGNATPVPSPGNFGVIVVNNTCIRTLPEVSSVASWSYDPRGLYQADEGVSGAWYTGPSTGLLDDCDGIIVRPGMFKSMIAGNVVSTTSKYGIVLRNYNNTDLPELMPLNFDVVIERNIISNFTVAGIGVDPAYGLGGTPQNVLMRHNQLDGDPGLKAAGRVPGTGKWASSASPVGIDTGTGTGFRIEDNEIKNVGTPVVSAQNNALRRNKLFCDPVSVQGYHADNRGIGACPLPGAEYEYIITDNDPMSANYGQQIAPAIGSAGAMPTSGKFVQGTFVRNNTPSVAGGKVLHGWLRLTTGSGNVSGVDWQPCYMSVS